MRPFLWPDWLDHVKAKSAEYGGETLVEHTWDVLEKLGALRRLRPTLPALVDAPRLWHCLFWACLLHDFGKAARGFQGMLAGAGRWRERHEVLSLVGVAWIADGLTVDERRWVVGAIVSHHRDAAEVGRLYPDVVPDPVEVLVEELDPGVLAGLWRWVDVCAAGWIAALGFSPDEVQPLRLMAEGEAVAYVQCDGARWVRACLDDYALWVQDMGLSSVTRGVLVPILLRGLTTTSDHMASAHLKEVPEPVQMGWQEFAARLLLPGQGVYAHQEASAAVAGQSALLVAPTGSGKTEAALFWALGDGSVPLPRLFYALPYQASMNAMFDRLRDERVGFGVEAVGLQHGRALQAMYARLLDQEQGVSAKQRRVARDAARWQRNMNQLHARPVKVFSPYQMLKAAFQLRGFEAMLTDYAQAAFVFDEIHAYDPGRLAMILALVRYLREWYGARFFVMSATFPQIIRDRLVDALGCSTIITADAAVFARFRRHRLHVLDGELLQEGVEPIVEGVLSGRRVLACVNTVRHAQELRGRLLAGGLAEEQVLLIHSRFMMRDRVVLEERVRAWCGLDVVGRSGFVLVATQVVEVSLNIDLDTIYTEPAPLEALLQRFGRVNRGCRKGICPVYVFRLPDDGQGVYGRLPGDQEQGRIVRVTLAELARHDGEEIDEAQTGCWLDAIYADSLLRSQWQEVYERMAQQADGVVGSLRAFDSSEQQEEVFERLFDSIDVLPAQFEKDYLRCIADHEFVEASGYFVGISTRKYAQLAREGLVRPVAEVEGKRRRWVVRLGYDAAQGLLFEGSGKDVDWD